MSCDITLTNCRLAAFPQPAQLNDYGVASAEIEALLCSIPGIVAAYRAGSVSVPGISDLDYVVVVDGRHQVPSIWSRLSERTRYLAMHSPCLTDVTTFTRHHWIASLEPLRLVHGQALSTQRPPLGDYAMLLAAVEGTLAIFLRLAKVAVTRYLKVRPFLCELNSLVYDLKLGRLSRDAAPAAWALVDEVNLARLNWFDFDESPGAVRGLAEAGPAAFVDAFRALAARAAELGALPSGGPLRLAAPWANVTVIPKDKVQLRVSDSPPDSLLRLSMGSRRLGELFWRRSRIELALPAVLVGLLAGVSSDATAEFHADRRQLVHHYGEFLKSTRSDYSPIGFASIFAPA